MGDYKFDKFLNPATIFTVSDFALLLLISVKNTKY